MPERWDEFKVSSTERQVVRALGSIGSATLVSRVVGFVRDIVVALVFGAGPVTDAFFVAFRIPNILRRLLAEGALSTAMIPVFSEYFVTQSRPEVLRMLRAVLALALVALGVTALLGIATAPWLVTAIAPGIAEDPARGGLAVLLTRVMFPYVVLVGLAALAAGALNAQGRFFASALGPAVQNVGMILAISLLASRVDPPILSLAIGVLLGGIGQLLVQLPSLRRSGLLVLPGSQFRHPALAAVFGLAAVQVMVFVNTLLASLLRPGSISYLYYADRVMEFPLGVFGIALASASLPVMARQAAARETRAVADTLNFSLRLAAYIALPAMAGLVVLRAPIVRVLFERGKFGPAETAATADALAWYAIGLAGFAGSRITAQVFYALGEAGTALVMMAPLGHAGLAGASSVGAYVNLVALLWAARRRLGPLGGRALVASVARTLAASLPLLVWCGLAVLVWPGSRSLLVDVLWLGGTIAGAVGLFWSASVVFDLPERTALLRMLPRAEPRSSPGA
ncbi:MAG: murein biosynthesis integral membrane protein MurJ [Candidatus Rokubacteria bacterium 13_1_20CM_70_15]|nr:MAG: murein biosynthesis integral membrane protein MurJ [Candidatus Rokubacteria bacterium 13_1_20CM_70_15]